MLPVGKSTTTHMKIALALTLLLSSSFLTGCVGTIANAQHANLISSGQPAEYADGYRDGFQAGQRAAGNPYAAHAKNVDRYLNDQKYKIGWDDGYNAGFGQYRSVQMSLN